MCNYCVNVWTRAKSSSPIILYIDAVAPRIICAIVFVFYSYNNNVYSRSGHTN